MPTTAAKKAAPSATDAPPANDETTAGTDTRDPDAQAASGASRSGKITVHLTGSSGFTRDVIAAVSAALREAEVTEAKVKQFADKAAKAADLEQFWAHVQSWVRVT